MMCSTGEKKKQVMGKATIEAGSSSHLLHLKVDLKMKTAA